MTYLLVAITLLIAVAGLFKDRVSEECRHKFIWGIIILLAISGVAQVFVIQKDIKRARYSRNTGVLHSLEKSSEQKPVLVLCKSSLVWGGPQYGRMFNIGDDFISLRMENGEAKLSMVLRDSNGIVRVTLSDNVWFVPKSESIKDWNFDLSGLEIIGPKDEIILQVHLNGEEVKIAGQTYPGVGGKPVTFGPLLTECDGTGGTIFKYPSEEFPGTRRVPNNKGT